MKAANTSRILFIYLSKFLLRCFNYFPAKNDSKCKNFGNYTVELIEENKNDFFTIRKIKLTPKKGVSTEPRIIHHFQYVNWPDFGVPEETTNFEKFVEAIRDLDDTFDESGPIVQHCSAGNQINVYC